MAIFTKFYGIFKALIDELDASTLQKEEIRQLIEAKNDTALSGLLEDLPISPASRALNRLPRLFGGADVFVQAADLSQSAAFQAALQELEQLYPQFTTDLAWETTKASGVLFKSGLMQALELLGLTDGSIYGETYHKLFGWNPRGIVLHSPEYLPVRQVLATAKASGGAVVFAHPTVYKSMPLLRELAAEGAVDGIEVYHPSNSPEDSAECLALCKQYGLVATAGTDFHGRNHKHPHPIGTCTAPDEAAAQLRAIAEKRKRERT